jgi:intracellular sulfur oxidation DsrE/DsrF family protein
MCLRDEIDDLTRRWSRPLAGLKTQSMVESLLLRVKTPASVAAAHLSLVRPMKTFIILIATVTVAAAEWPQAKSPAVPEADGYVAIPKAALPPAKESKYQAIFDATRAAEKATQLVPALNMAGSELNALAAVGAPLSNAKFAIVFHGPAVDAILDNDHYKTKFGSDNPNLKAIAEMKKHGVEFFVCGQYLAGEKLDPKTLTPDVTVAADALLVLMQYQNKGYALMSF